MRREYEQFVQGERRQHDGDDHDTARQIVVQAERADELDAEGVQKIQDGAGGYEPEYRITVAFLEDQPSIRIVIEYRA